MKKSIKGLLFAVACIALLATACTKSTSTSSSNNYQCSGAQDPVGPVYNNVPYGPDSLQRADIYPACTASAVGTILYVHGGGYSGGSKSEARNENVQRLRDLGWVIVSINYRLTPFAMWPAQGNDIHNAVDWWRTDGASDFSAPVGPLVGLGWSAGGHLVEHNNTQDTEPAVDASVSVSGGTYWPDRADTGSGIGLFGLSPSMGTLLDASSTEHLDSADAPLLHIHAESDFWVDPAQAGLLDDSITASGNPAIHSVQMDATCGHSLDCLKPAYVDPFLAAQIP